MGKRLPPILVAMNGFKGTLSNLEACEAVAAGLKQLRMRADLFPMGDGGRGTMDAIRASKGGEFVQFEVSPPYGGKTTARVLAYPNPNKPQWIYIESSEACGYHLIDRPDRDAMRASSLGLGEIIQACMDKWGDSVLRYYVGVGDSAISDMGMGMLTGLGFVFREAGGKEIWGNAHGLRLIHQFDVPNNPLLHQIKFTVLCDVLNPLLGPRGSARVFAKQKGASEAQIPLIERGMEKFANLIKEVDRRDLRNEPMTGAAGGLPAAFVSFFDTTLVQGSKFMMDWLGFDEHMENCRFVVTGEGKTDSQTLNGKGPFEVIDRADRQDKRVILLSGALGEGHQQLYKHPSLVACVDTGNNPTAMQALTEGTLEAMKNSSIRQKLGLRK